MISLFERNLKRMKQELTDLKTVHQRGLGTIRFFRSEFTFTPSIAHREYYIKGDIVAGEPERPFVQVIEKSNYANTNNGGCSIESGATEIGVQIYMNRAEQVTLEIVSTSETTNWRLDHVV